MAKYTGPRFIVEIRMYPAPWQIDRIEQLFNCSELMYNKSAYYVNKQLNKMREDSEYKRILNLYVNEKDETVKKQYGKDLSAIRESYGLTQGNLEKYINYQRNHSFKGTIDVDTAQKLAASLWRATSSCLFGTGKKVHYKKKKSLESLESKKNTAGIKFKQNDKLVSWNGMEIPVLIRKRDFYLKEALYQNKISYCRIIKKAFKSGYKYFLQVVLRGVPPIKPNRIINPKKGHVGLDIGPSTIAAVGEDDGLLESLAPIKVAECNKRIAQLNRELDRKRRAANPDNYNEDGTIKKEKLTWKRSKGYIKTLFKLKNEYRLRHVYLMEHHNILHKKIMNLGSSFSIEDINYNSWKNKSKKKTERTNKTIEITDKNGNTKIINKCKKKKRLGGSIQNNSPSSFERKLNEKLNFFGTNLKKVNTREFRASQYNHATDEYQKAPLNQRTKTIARHECQRDLYSAYLICNKADENKPDRIKCIRNFGKFLKIQDEIIKDLESREEKLPSCMGVKNKTK